MKIGLVFPYNIARGGGVKEIVLAMRAELEQRGHTAKIITPQPRDIGESDTDGVIFVGSATDFRSPLHTTTQLSVSDDMESIEQMIEAEKFDILHFHEPWVPVLSRQLLSRSKSVNVATFHAKVPETIMSRTLVKVVTPYLKAVLKDLHELTAVSEAAAEYVSRLTDKPIALIPNGIDLKSFKYTQHSGGVGSPKKILYIGRLERRKGVKYLLKAYSLLAQEDDDIALIIAGDGPDREKLEILARELNLPNVTFLGFINDKTKHELLTTSDLFCSPAIFGESFGIVLLEAMASGLVTVAGNNSGYASVLQDLGAVSLVNPEDSIEFARRLKLLLTEEDLRKLWRDWAKTYVRQFSYTKVVDQYEEQYRLALEHHAKNKTHV